MRIVIYPHKMHLETSRNLAALLACKRVYANRNYRPRSGDMIIGWGAGVIPRWIHSRALRDGTAVYVNRPERVCDAIRKDRTFTLLANANVPIPERTTVRPIAAEWIRLGATVYCRTILNSYGGKGIVVAKTVEDLVDAPLYTKRVYGREYRVHVFGDKVIGVAKKLKRHGVPPSLVRNQKSGYVFSHRDIIPPDGMESVAISAVQSIGLHFGAVDVIYEKDNGRSVVLEVNTAPGLGDTMLERYAQAIREWSANHAAT